MNDQEIIALYWAKEERAISATAEKYGGYCHTIAYNILYDLFASRIFYTKEILHNSTY